MSKSELDQFLETPEAGATVVAEETGKQDAPEETKASDETVDGKGEHDAETPAAEEDESTANAEEKPWQKAAYLDEKRKRQEREQELEQLRKELDEFKTQKQKQEEDEPDIFADPDGFKKSIKDSIRQESVRTRVGISREILMESKADYAEMEVKFIAMAKENPALSEKMLASSNPAKFAYETAKKQAALDDIGDPVSYREKLKAEILAELHGKSEPEAETIAKPKVEHTPSLANASAAKSNNEFHDPGLNELFSR